ncbi:nucleotide-diphospho-sugar transferase [Luteolibacter sp. AS25]|uniref:nucleotide-diphospho-sugar transferase n=1 Tax=Luteolibacter sp. AS25 TaxID=3135776 RepID=UPI00398B934C
MNSPILFLIFNRPDTTTRVFERIRSVKPPRLYVAADGPRPDREGEEALVIATREIATQVDWDCEVKTLFRDGNLGCGRAVSGGISWFFEHEEEGIILEDDVLPDETWFPFVDEMLERYRDEEHIMGITAMGYDLPTKDRSSYAFSIYNHCWGWASWRRAWQHYDYLIKQWQELSNTNWLLRLGRYNPAFSIYWTDIFNKTAGGKIDTWDYQWTFAAWAAGGLSIQPAANMVENIGFGEDATHTFSNDDLHAKLITHPIESPLVHPGKITADHTRDAFASRRHYGISWKTVLRKLIYRWRK